MFIRKLATLAAIAALGLLVLGAASASAHTVLRTDPGNSPLSGATQFTNTTSDHWTLSTLAGNITCSQASVTFDTTTHTGNPVINGTLTNLTFQNCTDTLIAVNIISCHLHASTIPTVSIIAIAGGAQVTFGHLILRCATNAAQACYYTSATSVGIYNNATASLHFSNIAANAVSPTTDAVAPANCGTNGNWSVTFTHIVQSTTNRTLTVATS